MITRWDPQFYISVIVVLEFQLRLLNSESCSSRVLPINRKVFWLLCRGTNNAFQCNILPLLVKNFEVQGGQVPPPRLPLPPPLLPKVILIALTWFTKCKSGIGLCSRPTHLSHLTELELIATRFNEPGSKQQVPTFKI